MARNTDISFADAMRVVEDLVKEIEVRGIVRCYDMRSVIVSNSNCFRPNGSG